jgi:hypothetical protein
MTPEELRDQLDEIVDIFKMFPRSCRDLLLEQEDAELLLKALNAFLKKNPVKVLPLEQDVPLPFEAA